MRGVAKGCVDYGHIAYCDIEESGVDKICVNNNIAFNLTNKLIANFCHYKPALSVQAVSHFSATNAVSGRSAGDLLIFIRCNTNGDIVQSCIEPCAVDNAGVHHTHIVQSQVQGCNVDKGDIYE